MTVELVEEIHNPSFESLKLEDATAHPVAAALACADPQQLAFVVARLKASGNEAFQKKRFREAVRLYDQVIAGSPKDCSLFGNRSAAHLALGLYQEAAADAQRSIELDSTWPKGQYRLGCARLAVGEWTAASAAFATGLALAPGNKGMVLGAPAAAADSLCAIVQSSKLQDAQQHEAKEAAARRAQQGMARRDLAVRLRGGRRADALLAQLNQVKQSMAAPDWELDDFEWRPTFRPSMKLAHQPARTPEAAGRRAALAGYIQALADLAAPKKALAALADAPRLDAFDAGIAAALRQKPDAHVLVLGAGGGLLALMAAAAGARRVTAVERSRMLYRMARQVLNANTAAPNAERIHLVDRKLQAVGVASERLPPDIEQAARELAARSQHDRRHTSSLRQQGAAAAPSADAADQSAPMQPAGAYTPHHGAAAADAMAVKSSAPLSEANEITAAGAEETPAASGSATCTEPQQPCIEARDAAALLEAAAVLPSRADVLFTDLFDHSVLGLGLLPAVDYAATRLLAPGAVMVPARVQVYAMLIELRIGEVAGFDLSCMNTYRWHPHIERIQLDRMPHRRLSQPFLAHTLDLQQRLAAVTAYGDAAAADATAACEASTTCPSGRAADAGCRQLAPFDAKLRHAAEWQHDETLDIRIEAGGYWNAVAFWFDLDMGAGSGVTLSSWRGPEAAQGAAADCDAVGDGNSRSVGASWQQSVQYLDGMTVQEGATVEVRVRQDAGQLHFAGVPPARRPRHASLPRWHFDMLGDVQRNGAYQAAIERAVALKRAAGCGHILALDIGAGSGLLSMMAARAGADQVVAAEMSGHMADAGGEVVAANGLGTRIMMIDKDARRMDVVRKPDGTPPDMERKADILVYEVFDSGLIGEGALHSVFAAKQKLLAPDALMVPAAATVYAQPLQLRRHGRVRGFDVSPANRWHWRPDYEGLELGLCRDEWTALGPVMEVMGFDFYAAEANMAPALVELTARFTETGVWNSVAFWFQLQLDEETSLDTSPYCDKGNTWQQAVQWMEEVAVAPGMRLPLTASHDTYGISFARGPLAAAAGEPESASGADAADSAAKGGSTQASVAPTGVPLQDHVWEAAYKQLAELNGQLAKSCVQNPLEFRSVAAAAVAFGARPHDFGLDTDQAVDFCTKMMA